MPEEMIGYEWKKLNLKLCFPEQSRTRSKNHNLVAKKLEVTFSLGLGDQIIPQYENCIRLGLDLKCMYLSIQIVARELRGIVIFLQRVYWNVFQFWLDLANILKTSWQPFVSPPKREGNKLQQSSIPFATTMSTLRTGICNIQPAMVYNGDSALMGLSFWRKHRVLFKAKPWSVSVLRVGQFCDISFLSLSSYAGF